MPWWRVKVFFHWATTITTLWSRKKKCFVSSSYYDHYTMIKREKFFFHWETLFTNEERKMFFFVIYYLRSPRHDPEKKGFLFHLATTITAPWSREKKFFFIYVLRSLRHDHERKMFFHLATIFTNKERKMFFFI